MDEPTVGIDPQSRRRILDTVLELNRQGLTVLYTTHYMEEAAELSDRIGIVDQGKLIALGTQVELTRTVGELETLRIGVDSTKVDAATLLPVLEQVVGVRHATLDGDALTVQVEDAKAALSDVIAHLDRAGAKVLSLRVEEPNLEAVFLNLTGRALRD
jgi:ABC-2 type transport system ATP-binding protein